MLSTLSTSTDMEPRSRRCERISVAGIDAKAHAFEVGARIRALREARNVTQTALAEAARVKPHTMWRYETQGMMPGPAILAAIAAKLETTSDYLVTGGGDAPTIETTVDRDETLRTALIELQAAWSPALLGPPLTADEFRYLSEGYDFRDTKPTPRILLRLIEERRARESGKALQRPRIEPPAPNPGTRKLSDADKNRKKKR